MAKILKQDADNFSSHKRNLKKIRKYERLKKIISRSSTGRQH